MITVTRQRFVETVPREEAPLMVVLAVMEEHAPETSAKLLSIRTDGVIQFVWKTTPDPDDMSAVEKVMARFPWVWNTSPFFV